MVQDLDPTMLGLEPFWKIRKLFRPPLLPAQRPTPVEDPLNYSTSSTTTDLAGNVAVRPLAVNWTASKAADKSSRFSTVAAS